MIRMLALRLTRLEQARPQVARRLVHVYATCQRPGESQEETLRRHGLAPGLGEPLVMQHRYGRCRLCAAEGRSN